MTKNRVNIRLPVDFSYLWYAKGRENYVTIVKNMGITDICECTNEVSFNRRRDSGKLGQVECARCRQLVYPLNYVYPCDSCTEPTLADEFPVSRDTRFLCSYCLVGE